MTRKTRESDTTRGDFLSNSLYACAPDGLCSDQYPIASRAEALQGPSFLGVRRHMSKITDHSKAAQRARVIASDMAIYPDIQRKIEAGIKNDNLFVELQGLMNEARQHFQSYVSEDIVNNTNILEKAFIDIVFVNFAHVESSIW